MKFGSQEDFKTAITELKWIMKTFGKVSRRDFETVSAKYNFPTDFLKAGLKGLMLEADDYRISTSKWFPIIFSWDWQRKEVSDERLHIDFLSSRFSVIRTHVTLLTDAEDEHQGFLGQNHGSTQPKRRKKQKIVRACYE
jgi:hypothetical protein